MSTVVAVYLVGWIAALFVIDEDEGPMAIPLATVWPVLVVAELVLFVAFSIQKLAPTKRRGA